MMSFKNNVCNKINEKNDKTGNQWQIYYDFTHNIRDYVCLKDNILCFQIILNLVTHESTNLVSFHFYQSNGQKILLHQIIWKTLLFQNLNFTYLRRLIDGNFILLTLSLLLRSDFTCVLCSLLVPTRGLGLKGWKSLYNTIIPSVSLEKALVNSICIISFPAISDGISRNRHFKTLSYLFCIQNVLNP
jgi:hypothetical protein